MNKVEIIDKTMKHLMEQGPSEYHGSCMYRLTKNGKTLKCAAGFWISDEDYMRTFEGKRIVVIVKDFSGDSLKFIADNIELIDDMQRIHDKYSGYNQRIFAQQIERDFTELKKRYT